MRLIDADEYARDMKVRQDAALKWCDDAKTRCDYADYALAESAVFIFCEAKLTLDKQPTVDAVPVVRCEDCINYVESEEANGNKMCVRDADWCVEDGCYYGFTEYPSPDWFCADGERKGGDE